MENWIKIEDALPDISDKSITVMVYIDPKQQELKYGNIQTSVYTANGVFHWNMATGAKMKHVTHWQYLPEPPKN